MSSKHSYIACVRDGTQGLPDIDSVSPFNAEDDACLKDLDDVLRKHGASSRFGINLLHSHFPMSDDELLLEETDIENRRQTISVVKRSSIPDGAIFMDRRFDRKSQNRAVALFHEIEGYENPALTIKIASALSISNDEALTLFEDVKRFIALCSTASEPLAPPRIVDQAWHEFILFTKDYAKFCNEFCGRYIHHQPASPLDHSTDYGGARRRTRELAEAVFGKLSANWDHAAVGSKCTHNCGTGDIGRLQQD